MNEKPIRIIASIGLIIGGLLGFAGSFAPSAPLRGLAWGVDGVALIIAGALLTVYSFRHGHDTVAAGFLVFSIGEGLILSCSGINPESSIPAFGAGTGLWAASLLLISSQRVFPVLINCTGFVAAALFAVVSIRIFIGDSLSPLTKPLPFYVYPFFVLTIFGWAWTLLRTNRLSTK